MIDSPIVSGDDPLERGRSEIERIDRAMVTLLAERVLAGTLIASAKVERALPILDPAQEARVVRRAAEWARAVGLPDEEVRELFWRIIAITRRAEDASR